MDNIPDHILLKIFKRLDKDSIKVAATICDRWHQIISTSSVIMNRLDTVFNMKNPGKLADSIAKLNSLPYKSIIIRPKFYQDPKLLSKSLRIFKKHANHIEKVEFFLASSSTIMKTMKNLHCDKITSLTISQSYKENIDDFTHLRLPNLKSLETHQASGLLKMIKEHRLENLKIIHDYDDYDTADDRINKFLLTCSGLKTLLFEHHFPIIEVEKMEFKLTHLTVSNVEERQKLLCRRQYETLKKLLDKSFETLELFLLGNFIGVDGILEYLLPRAKKLQYLFLVCPTISRIDENMARNTTITDLAVTLAHNCDTNVEKTRRIIKSCVGVEKLGLNSITHDVSPLIHEAAKSMPKLRELSIYSAKGKSFKNIPKFENLKTLYIERVSHQTDIKPLVNIIMACPNVKKLKIELWGGDRLAFLSKDRLHKILTTCRELEEIFIGGLFKLPNSFVEGILETESNLKNLVIETYDTDMIKENGRKLLKSKIRCTALQWRPKSRLDEDAACSDNEDYDFFDEGPDDHRDGADFDVVFDFFDDDDVELNDDDDDDDEDMMNMEDVAIENEPEIDDRFDETGRRRSKRLRLR